jgi:hypothetical protein
MWKPFVASMASHARHHGGSHYKIAHHTADEILTIPSKRRIKPVYIRKLVAFIDGIRTSQ